MNSFNEKLNNNLKEKKRMLEFMASTYRNALTRQKKAYAKLLEGQPSRERSYAPMFKTDEELKEYYNEGNMTDDEYRQQRMKMWQVYSDRGHINNIRWLEEELENVENRLKLVEEKKRELRNINYKYYPSVARKRHTNYVRNRRRKMKKKEMEERWHRYGIW